MALVKYNNNSISAITAASNLSSAALTLIKSQTASSSADITFEHGSSDVVLDSTYPIYLFKWISCHPATNNVKFQFQANAAGGDNYNETITSTAFNATANAPYGAQGAQGAFVRYDPMRNDTQVQQQMNPYSVVNNAVVDAAVNTNGLILMYTASELDTNRDVHSR